MSLPTLKADLALDVRAELGEGPLWDGAAGRLHFVDITQHRIHTWSPDPGGVESTDVAMMVGCIAPQAEGRLVAALASGIWSIDLRSGRRTFLATPPEHDANRCRFNDGKCDPEGRLWAGTMGLNAERGVGALYCFPGASQSTRALEGVTISNGLAWTSDGNTMYYIDSPTRRVDAFDFDGDTGRIARRRPAIELPAGADLPDGCTIDAEDMLWIAHWGGNKVTRWDPRRGVQLATVHVPAPHVSSCTFGGPTLDTLYITTARRGMNAAQLGAWPTSGGIFACRPGATGTPAAVFRG